MAITYDMHVRRHWHDEYEQIYPGIDSHEDNQVRLDHQLAPWLYRTRVNINVFGLDPRERPNLCFAYVYYSGSN